MDHDALFALLLDILEQDAMPDAESLGALVRDGRLRARMLAQPRLPPLLARIAQQRSGIACATAEDELAVFIERELRGDDVSAVYQDVHVHLEHCPECYEHYSLAKRMVRLQQDGRGPRWPISAGVYMPPVVPTILVVPRHEIQRAFTMHARHAVMRGTREHSYILYSGDMPGRPGMFVEVTMERRVASTSWNIVVQLNGSGVGSHLHISLQCSTDVLWAVTNQGGAASFEDIPDAWTLDGNAVDLHVSVVEP
jgi:hypothetical protein